MQSPRAAHHAQHARKQDALLRHTPRQARPPHHRPTSAPILAHPSLHPASSAVRQPVALIFYLLLELLSWILKQPLPPSMLFLSPGLLSLTPAHAQHARTQDANSPLKIKP